MKLHELQFTAPPEHPRALPARIEHAVARFLLGLSPATQRRLSGRAPLAVDGLTLHPELQLMLRAQQLSAGSRGLTTGSLDQARAQMRRDCMVHEGECIAVANVRDFALATRNGPLRARHYAPEQAEEPLPLCVFFHGGGFVLGDLETHDAACRLLCKHAGVHVLAIDYRLAPEHPFPAAVDDALDALRFAVAHAAELGADPRRVGVAGDSAGGNLAAVAGLLARDHGERVPDFAALIYPVVDFERTYPSQQLFGEGLLLTTADRKLFDRAYFGEDPALRSDPRLSPLLGDLRGLCPALVVTAGFDLLRDEAEAYARALEQAGNRVIARREPELIHGFLNLFGVSPACRAACMRIAADLRGLSRG
jgi:acetyl esterase